MGVIGLISNDGRRGRIFQQHVCTFQIVGLPGHQMQARRITKRVVRDVDLGAEATATASDGLVAFFAPFFEPRTMLVGLTMVESWRIDCPHRRLVSRGCAATA